MVLSGERWKISDVKSDRLHFHNCLEIGVCHSWSGHMDFGENSWSYKAGDFTFVMRNFPHTTYSDAGDKSLWSYIFVDLEGFFKNQAQINSIVQLISSVNYYIMNKEESPKLYNYVTAIIDEMTAKSSGYMTCVSGLMTAIVIELSRLSEKHTHKQEPINNSNMLTIHPALNYIYDNYTQQFPIEHLADLCHLSVTHFRRIFNSIMGTSPLEYINNTRIDHACVLLQRTDTSILEISEMVGFHSVSSFNRAFYKVMETSPREWRKKHNQGETVTKKQSVLEYHGWL